MFFRNIGLTNYRRYTGDVVAPGEVFEAINEKEVRVMTSALEIGSRVAECEAPKPEEEQAVNTDDDDAPIPAWTLKLSPAEYLKKYPKGPQAKFAKELIEAD